MRCPFPPRSLGLLLAIGLLLEAAVARSASGQTPPPGAVCSAPATDPTVDPPPEPAASGWLILRGRLIPGPYTVTVESDTVAVNGSLFSLPAASSTASLDPGPHAALFEQFWSLWQGWCSGGDLTGAIQRAQAWWQAAPGVASAAIVPPGSADLQLLFAGDQDYQVVSLQAPDDQQPPPDDASHAAILAELAQDVVYDLSHGHLLVVQDEGNSFLAAAGESADLMGQIQQISTLPTVGERLQALGAIIPDAQMASAIAQNLNAAAAAAAVQFGKEAAHVGH